MKLSLKLLNIDKELSKLPEIKETKYIKNGKFTRDGLFSLHIFGPIKSYTCQCPDKIGVWSKRINIDKCPTCGVEITTDEHRYTRISRIKLPFPIMNPLFYLILTETQPHIKKIFDDFISYKIGLVIDEELKDDIKYHTINIQNNDEPIDENIEYEVGLNAIEKYIEIMNIKTNKKRVQYVYDNMDKLYVHNILVIPPAFRPLTKMSTGKCFVDEINKYYTKLLIRCNLINNLFLESDEQSDIYRINFKHIQNISIEIYRFILDKLSGKSGILRSNILGKRLDFSGRAVITPDANLKLNECSIPYWMLLEILKPELSSYLLKRRVYNNHIEALNKIEECMIEKKEDLLIYIKDLCKDKVCILNRQPTLHRLGIMAFKIKVNTGYTIKIDPMICEPFNADYDGDCMAVYIPIEDIAIIDAKRKLMVDKNLCSPTNLEIITNPNQDIILGLYQLTNEKKDDVFEVYKGKKISLGRKLFNMCLPDNYPVIDEEITKNNIKDILNNIVLNYSSKIVIDVLFKIKKIGLYTSTKEGYTLSLSDLLSSDILKLKDNLKGNPIDDIKYISENEELKTKLKDLSISTYIESGARGSWDQAKQLVFARGYVADSDNKIRPDLIKSSLIEGLSQDEFFRSSYGCRKGLLDIALSTGDSGYLTRQIIYSTSNLELSETIDDCHTSDYFKLHVYIKDDENNKIDYKKSVLLAKSLLWRYYIDDNGNEVLITTNNYKDLIGKTINLRSPILCNTKQICKKCYGNLYKILHSDQIGIIATQAIGERITQLVLRTFHTSGVASRIKDDSNDDIIAGMGLANKLFHPKGDLKYKTAEEYSKLLFNIFSDYGSIHFVHFECIVSCMMWSKNKPWRLLDNRLDNKYVMKSTLKIPAMNSWLIGTAFSHLKSKIIDALINDNYEEPSSISSLFLT